MSYSSADYRIIEKAVVKLTITAHKDLM